MTSSIPTSATGSLFFRDTIGLKLLKDAAVHSLVEDLSPNQQLRVWVPQCSAGHDAYSIAICLIEAMGSRWREIPLRVFSTDSDEDSLARARAGRYPLDSCRNLPGNTFERFFVHDSSGVSVRPFVRDACRFAGHDLAQYPLFSSIDLIASRETLATMSASAREGALRSYYSILTPKGVLLDQTGSAVDAPELFHPVGSGRSYVARKTSMRPGLPGMEGQRAPIADARLKESEERFRILFSQAEDSILVQDPKTGFIAEANDAAQRLFGWSSPEFIKLRVKDLIVAPEVVRRAKNERRSEDRLRLPHCRRKDGTLFPADTNSVFFMREGRPCNIWVLRDATQRLKLGFGQKHENDHAAFMGEVVHELRSPLAIIRLSAESLRQGEPGARKRKDMLRFIENHTVRMAELVDRLLDLSAADSSKRGTSPTRVALADFFWNTVSPFVPIAKRRGIRIRIDVPAGLAVLADRFDLPHVFGNLLDNAIKFTPKGGEISISGRAAGGEGVVSVEDSGCGIAPEDLSRVFERFFRGERARKTKGTGLGLAIVHGMVQANHGRILAENSPSGGAVFRVALPLAPDIQTEAA